MIKARKTAITLLLLALAAPVLGQGSAGQGKEGNAFAQSDQILAQEIWRLLRLDALIVVMSDEAGVNGQAGLELLLPDEQEAWQKNLARINSPERLSNLLSQGLDRALKQGDPVLIRRALLFYKTDLGEQLVGLELSARQAMISPDGKESAIMAAQAAAAQNSPRLAQIDRLMAASRVVDVNVASSLNAILASTRGFAQASQVEIPEEDMTADAWQQEPAIRDDIADWIRALLYLAYSPLSDDDIERVITFVGSPEGQELAGTLGVAFDGIFTKIAYETGIMSAGRLVGADL